MSRADRGRCFVGDGHDEARRDWLTAIGVEANKQVRIVEDALALHYKLGGTRRGVGCELRTELHERLNLAHDVWKARDEFYPPGTIHTRSLWS